MSDVKCARMLLSAAERDLLTLRSMTADAPDESFGFHVQQAAEKALKAWLPLLGEQYPLTHNIGDWLDFLVEQGVNMAPFEALVGYTPYSSVEFRYHGVDSVIEPIDRDSTVALVEALLEELRKELMGEEVE